jgi:endonuclease/exonuclease/phosphatase family metal-dependent hydrolase
MCEVENREVLYDLCNTTSFIKAGYNIVHEESNDNRGIDVALLYRPDLFKLSVVEKISMRPLSDTLKKGRDILYVMGRTTSGKILHIYINHWPSKYGGVTETEDARCEAAKALNRHAQKYLSTTPDALVIIMGDLNDTIEDESVKSCLRASYPGDGSTNSEWYELIRDDKFPGTHKHGSEWSIIDHIIVSRAMLGYLEGGRATIHSADFLLTTDESYTGVKPYRTYEGFRYTGGFSDHLPVKASFKFP